MTVGGKGPPTGGTIRFVSVADPTRVGAGQIKADGSFVVSDAPVGECKVVIDNVHLNPSSNKATGMPGIAGRRGGMPGMKGMPGGGAGAAPSAGPKEADKAKMAAGPKGAEVPEGMNSGKTEHAAEKYVKIEAGYSKPDTTPLNLCRPVGNEHQRLRREEHSCFAAVT